VFYAPIEVKNASEVFYRETRNESIVKKATDQVRASFVREKDFLATSVFIATWKNVAHADGRFPNKVKQQLCKLSANKQGRRVLASGQKLTHPSPNVFSHPSLPRLSFAEKNRIPISYSLAILLAKQHTHICFILFYELPQYNEG